MQSNTYFIPLLQEYMKHFGIPSERKDLQLLLQSSPSFPSVLSIIQACIYFGLNTKAYKADYDALLKNSMPAIVHLKENSDEKYVLVEKVTDKRLVYKDFTTLEAIEITAEEFIGKWTGILVLSEKSKEEWRVQNNISRKKYGVVVLFLMIIRKVSYYKF